MSSPVQHSARDEGTIIVKVVTRSRDGRPLHEGQLFTSFPTRQTALETIQQHLQQFDRTGYDSAGDYWWGRSLCEPCEETLFFIT